MSSQPSAKPLDEELLSAYLDGQVSEQTRQELEARFASDPRAAHDLGRLRQVKLLLSELPREPLPRAFTLSEAQVGSRRPSIWEWLGQLQPAYLRAATVLVAICLLVLAAGDGAVRYQWLSSSPGQEAVSSVETGGLAPEEGDPTAIMGKASTTEPAAQPAGTFLGLPAPLLTALQVVLLAALLFLLAAHWQLSHLN